MSGQINAVLEGRTIERALTDGKQLILQLTNGPDVRIDWYEGTPRLVGVSVKIRLPAMGLTGALFGQ